MNNFQSSRCEAPAIAPFITDRNLIMALQFYRKRTPRDARNGLCDEVMDEHARVIAARRSAMFACFPSTRQMARRLVCQAYDYKLSWASRAAAKLFAPKRSRIGTRWSVCGDFNVAPNDEDMYDPALWRAAIMCSDGERTCIPGIMRHWSCRHASSASSRSRIFQLVGLPDARFRRTAACRIDAITWRRLTARDCRIASIRRPMVLRLRLSNPAIKKNTCGDEQRSLTV